MIDVCRRLDTFDRSAEWKDDELSSAVVERARKKLAHELGKKGQGGDGSDSEAAQLAAFRIIHGII